MKIMAQNLVHNSDASKQNMTCTLWKNVCEWVYIIYKKGSFI